MRAWWWIIVHPRGSWILLPPCDGVAVALLPDEGRDGARRQQRAQRREGH